MLETLLYLVLALAAVLALTWLTPRGTSMPPSSSVSSRSSQCWLQRDTDLKR